MRVFVTGGGGFIGSYLCRELAEQGHAIAVLSRSDAPWRLQDLRDRLLMVRGDLDTLAECTDAIEAFAPDAVAHLGWAGVANFDRDSPAQIKNIGWSASLYQIARAAGARTFLCLGSQAEFGPKADVIPPDADTCPTTLYGEVKLATGRILRRLCEADNLRFVWMRVFSTYGPTDNPYWMIPSLIDSLLRGERPALTEGAQAWDFLHAADAARAIRLALERSSASGYYNLGSGRAPTLRSTIASIRDEIDRDLPLGFGDVPYRPDQVMRLQADVTRLQDDLGWQPQIALKDGLAQTVAWYSANRWIFQTAPTP